jgi:RNA polymerase sigma-70 factor (ECF subfamily)
MGPAFGARIVRDSHAAEDIFQEACLRLQRRGVRELSDRAGCRGLLFKTLLNLSRDLLRDRAKRRPTESPPARERDPAATAENAEELSRVRAALARIGERQRRALVLKTVDGLSYKEIAVRLRVSETNVGVLIFRAREKLREVLGLREDRAP